jgi:hypothetical protein
MKLKNIFILTLLQFTSIFAKVCELNTNCISFTVSQGTGCQWMCNYCATALNTNNYYFLDNVCTYQSGGCVGNPQSGVTYSCCTSSS